MLSVPTQFASDRVTINGISLCYYRSGGDKPTLIMAHGMTDMGLCWTRVADGLRHKYDVVMYDARGHGQSDTTENGHDPEQRAEDLRGLCTTLGLRNSLLLGHSMGAMTVGILAAKYPELARAIVLEDPPMPASLTQTPTPAQLATLETEWNKWKAEVIENRNRTQEELVSMCRRKSAWWHELEITPWATAKRLVNPQVFNTANLRMSNWWQYLAQVTCPLLVITADVQRGALINETVADELRATLPDSAMLVRLPGAGHSVHREQFDRYMSLMTDFFARS